MDHMEISEMPVAERSESESILQLASEKWGYDRNRYWLPLASIDCDFDWLFIMEDYLEDYQLKIMKCLFKGGSEKVLYVPLADIDKNIFVFDMDQFMYWNRFSVEYACIPFDVSWIYYHSHEHTVSFAGSILRSIKKIIESVRVKWNEYEGV
jgi:hypothetical protein